MKTKGYEYFFRESILISIEKERRREYGLKHPRVSTHLNNYQNTYLNNKILKTNLILVKSYFYKLIS